MFLQPLTQIKKFLTCCHNKVSICYCVNPSTVCFLLEHFSSKTLSIENCPEDELGRGYEYLIKKFADDSGHTAQEFYTNRTVVHLMTELLKPEPGESIYEIIMQTLIQGTGIIKKCAFAV